MSARQADNAYNANGFLDVALSASASTPASAHASSYVTQRGETLQTVARAVYGDARLWYRLADANGLSGGPSDILSEGLTLALPNLDSSANSVDTFRPYDPSTVSGQLDAVLPALPMPQDQGGGGCGAMGNIIMLAVTLVVAYYTGQAATSWLTSPTGLSAGTAGVVGGAAGAAAGSIAGQTTGMALGVVKDFSWSQVALSAVSAGIGQGLGGDLLGTKDVASLGNTVVRAAIGSALTQGVAVVTGLQDHFDWTSVAASAVGAGVGSAVSGQFGGGFGGRLATGLIAGTAAAVARGGKVSIQQVATDAFGNALGGAFVDNMRSPGQQDIPIDQSQRKAMELGFGPLNPSAASQAVFISQFDLRSHFAPTDGTDQFEPIDATGSGASVTGAGEAMSFEEFRRQEIAYRNRTEVADVAVEDADLRQRGPRLSAAGFADYEALGTEMTGWQVNKAFRSNDPNHFVIGAFLDGTWNKRPAKSDLLDTEPGNDYTNVGLLQLLSQGAQSTNFQAKYFPGVGTEWYSKHVGGATGAGVTMGAEEAYNWMSENVNKIYENNSSATFDFVGVGFSRGALETRMLLRMIDQRGIPDYASRYEVMHGEANIEVRYGRNIVEPGKSNLNAVIFDTVTTGVGDFYNIDVPTRAQVYHPIARDEMRALFPSAPLARVGQEMSPSWFQPVVAGDHSDIGNNHDRGGIGDMNLKLAHQFMTQKLGLPMMAIPSAYTPNPQNMWIHDMRGNNGVAPSGTSPFVRPVAPRYMPLQPNPSPSQW